MNAIIGKKVGMTRVTDKFGRLVGATVIQATPNSITLVRTQDRDGYQALQLGHGDPKGIAKPQAGHLSVSKSVAGKTLIEVRMDGSDELPVAGSELTVDTFKPGDIVNVIATSKGRGFAGTVKRHNFRIGPRSHGSMNQRRPGSIGAQQPQRVIKGKKMSGHLGAARTTVKHLEVLDVLPSDHLLVLRGSVPGIKGATILIKASPRHAHAETVKDTGGEE